MQRWQIELLPGQRLDLAPSVTLRQKGPGLQVRLAERAARADRSRDEKPRDEKPQPATRSGALGHERLPA
jgi:hypothetical protein